MTVKWHVTKVCDRWWAVGLYVRVFDTWEDAIAWASGYHGTEPCS